MRSIRITACLLAAFAAGPALAQDKPDGEWRGSFSFGLSLARGNSESTSLNIGADAVRATPEDKVTLKAAALRGESETDGITSRTAELASASGRYERNFARRSFAYASLALEHDGMQDLELRRVLGAGLGYHLVARDAASFDVFAGLAATRENYETRDQSFTEAMLGEESSHRITQAATFKQKLVVYPNLDEGGQWRAEFDASLAAAINDSWSLKVTLTQRYQSDPLPGLEKADTLLLIGLSGKFGPG